MRVLRVTGVLMLGLCSMASGQSPATSAPAAAGDASDKAVTTIKANAKLVTLDVVVKDSKGRPVHGLKASDFAVTENGAPQAVTHFEEFAASTLVDATRFHEMPKLPANIFTNYTPVPANGVVNVVLLDALNTPMTDQVFVRQQLLDFVKTLEPGARVAIFGLNQRLTMLQGFTSDPEILKEALTRTKAKGSALLDDQVGGSGIQDSIADQLEQIQGISPDVVANLREFEEIVQVDQQNVRSKTTLDAMNQLARYLAMLPGRKNLIWFSGSFPINVLPDSTGSTPDPFRAMADVEDEFRQTVRMLSAAQVAVYPVDARGLFGSPMFNASTNANPSGARMQQSNQKFFVQTAQEHGTMLEMASATGGRAFVNTNGLAAAARSAIEEGSNFYSMAYVPSNSAEDGKLRKIRVRVAQSGLTLAYRQGYYADLPSKLQSIGARMDAAAGAGVSPNPHDALNLAMMRGAPVPTEILLEVGVVPATPPGKTEESVATGNRVIGKQGGPFRRYAVNIAPGLSTLNFVRAADGNLQGAFDLLILVYTPNGELVNSQQTRLQIAAPLEQLRKAAAEGMIWRQEISTPAKGEYFLRIGVRDEHSGHFGAVEVVTSSLHSVSPPVAASTEAKPN